MRWTISLLCCRAPWPTRCSCPTHMDTVGADIGISAHHRHGVIRTDGSTILGANDKSGIAGCLELLRLLLLPAHQPRLLEQRLGEDPATSHKLTARTAHGGGERRGPGVLPHHQAAELPGSIAAASEVTSSSLSSIARSESYVRSSPISPVSKSESSNASIDRSSSLWSTVGATRPRNGTFRRRLPAAGRRPVAGRRHCEQPGWGDLPDQLPGRR
jgi:hypothetical protein